MSVRFTSGAGVRLLEQDKARDKGTANKGSEGRDQRP